MAKKLAGEEQAKVAMASQLKAAQEQSRQFESALEQGQIALKEVRAAVETSKAEKVRLETEVAQLGAELDKGRNELSATAQKAQSELASMRSQLDDAKSITQKLEQEIDIMADRHASEMEALARENTSLKAEATQRALEHRAEVEKLKAETLKAERKAAEMESRIGSGGPVRPAPGSIAEAAEFEASREEDLSAARGAAASAAERAPRLRTRKHQPRRGHEASGRQAGHQDRI